MNELTLVQMEQIEGGSWACAGAILVAVGAAFFIPETGGLSEAIGAGILGAGNGILVGQACFK